MRRTISADSCSSTSTDTLEAETSVWVDEKMMQEESRTALNHALGIIGGGRNSPLLSTLNTEWNDISRTQQNYYVRKVNEAIPAEWRTAKQISSFFSRLALLRKGIKQAKVTMMMWT